MGKFESFSIVIQARLSSTRLSGKVLKPFYLDQNILSIQLTTLKQLGLPIILATTTNTNDDPLEQFALKNNLECFRGSESDVLSRFIDASSSTYVIRVCSDNPFLDTTSIQYFIDSLEEETDYISFMNGKSIPAIKTHWGLFTEIVSRKALLRAKKATSNHPVKKNYREHVTNYIYGHPDQFNIKLLIAPNFIVNRSDLRFTVDTLEDFKNMQDLYKIVLEEGGDLSLTNLINTVDKNDSIKKIMMNGIQRFDK